MKILKCCILLLTLCLAACFDEVPANTPEALVSAEPPAPQAVVPAQLPAPPQAAAPTQVVVNQSTAMDPAQKAWYEKDLALKQQAIEQSAADAALSAKLQKDLYAHFKGWGGRFLGLVIILVAIVGIFAIAVTVLFWHNRWMDRHPDDYNKDEFDKLVKIPSPTEAQARMAGAISRGIASRRIALALVVAGGSVAVGLVLA